MTIHEKKIDVDGQPVHLLEAGEENNRALLLLAGGIGDASADWQAILPTLAETFHVYAPDLPGFSGSAALPEMSFAALTHWTRALLDTLEQSDTVIVAHSVGAIVARLFAAESPEYVPALVLVNGGAFPRIPPFVPGLIHLPLIGDTIFQLFGRIACGQKSLERLVKAHEGLTDALVESWQNNAASFVELMRMMLCSTYPPKRTPLMPTLLLWGTDDPMMTMGHAERLKKEIPGALLTPITACGHLPPLEASDAFVFQLLAFLDHLNRPPAPVFPARGAGLLHST